MLTVNHRHCLKIKIKSLSIPIDAKQKWFLCPWDNRVVFADLEPLWTDSLNEK
jgi:hypothetical protein